jgi:hypothetical protein
MAFEGNTMSTANTCKTYIYVDVALLSEPHERFFIPNYYFYWTAFQEEKTFPITIHTLDRGKAYS